MTVTASDLVRALDQALTAVSTDQKRPLLDRVLVDASAGSLRLVATDQRRLVVSELSPGAAHAAFSAVVAASALAPVRDLDGEAAVTVVLDGDALEVRTDDATIRVPIVHDEFPDFGKVLASVPTGEPATVDRGALLAAIEGAEDDAPLRLQLRAGVLDVGDPAAPVDAQYAGPELTVLVDPGFAHDAVASAPGRSLVIEATGPVSPIVVRSASTASYTCVLMPIRVAEPRPRR